MLSRKYTIHIHTHTHIMDESSEITIDAIEYLLDVEMCFYIFA